MSSVGPRSTPEEIVAKYELEPALSAVFVEGGFDRLIVSRSLAAWGQTVTTALEADTIAIDATYLLGRGLSVSAKGRVIGLALRLDEIGAHTLRKQIVCMVDTDCDDIVGTRHHSPTLLYTVGTSLEVILLAEPLLEKFFLCVLPSWPMSAREFLVSAGEVLRARFLHRVCLANMNVDDPAVDLKKDIEFDPPEIRFDESKYLVRVFSNLGFSDDDRLSFVSLMSTMRDRLPTALSQAVHVDDFLALLQICLQKRQPNFAFEPLTLRRVIFGVAEPEHLRACSDIRAILDRISPGEGVATMPV